MNQKRHIAKLNALLASELGTNPYGAGIFSWEWSNELFWPPSPTGNRIPKVVQIPIIGTDRFEEAHAMEPEMKAMPMTLKYRDSWLITKWLAPEQLQDWDRRFPGAPYPARGYRIHTDWVDKPHQLPTLHDTELFIIQAKEQMGGMTAAARLRDMEEERDKREAANQRMTEDCIEDSFTAFLNPFPGKRGHFVSFPEVKPKEILNG